MRFWRALLLVILLCRGGEARVALYARVCGDVGFGRKAVSEERTCRGCL